jgi:hypothetical protein
VRVTLSFHAKAVKRRAKLSGAYLAEFDRALAWAALPTAERAARRCQSWIAREWDSVASLRTWLERAEN